MRYGASQEDLLALNTSKAKQSKAKAKQSKAKQSKAKQSKAKQSKAKKRERERDLFVSHSPMPNNTLGGLLSPGR